MSRVATIYSIALLALCVLGGCREQRKPGALHFSQLKADETGIDFNNLITENDSVNVYENEYMYNGSGVGVGDFNNDGLPDLFFAGSMVSSRLYLNKGSFRFEDITAAAGLSTAQWCTGVSVADVNGDGYADIYVSTSHSHDGAKRANRLFINDGKLHFNEMAAAYGLADTGCTTQAAFFDYDKDGDLDMYLLNHRLFYADANSVVPIDTTGNSPAADKLYRNDGIPAGGTHPVFSDVSKEAGIKEDGYGLGVVISDVNGDNWPDVYVANDYLGDDRFWLNNRNGTFTNIAASALKHESYNSMGVDVADINNDGRPDVAVLDMMPETNERKKMMFSAASQEKYDMAQRLGYHPAFVRNMLQLNNGVRLHNSNPEPYFSEVGQFAGMSETDWSWSVLMADFDNDGWKDIHITNGLAKDVTNNDYAAFRSEHVESGYSFAASYEKAGLKKETIGLLRKELDSYGSVKVDNYFYRNEGGLSFRNATADAGLNVTSVSNGAAYVDLDNDGDLDLVVNNMNEAAFVWRNELRQTSTDTLQNFLAVQLEGVPGNNAGFGARLFLYNGGGMQSLEQSPVRGFSSSVDPCLHFGVGRSRTVDSLKIIWPNDKVQVIRNVGANRRLVLKESDAALPAMAPGSTARPLLFTELASAIQFRHTENAFSDFGNRRPLPQKYSQLGPCLATGDINGDGLTDFFVGGAANEPGKLFFQKADGSFSGKNLVEGEKPEEDLGAALFDADGDGDLDLLVTGGSQEFGTTTFNHPRFYSNDGSGQFGYVPAALPQNITDITNEIGVADYDGDGDLDLFVGGRLSPGHYPKSPRSYLLQNNGGRFSDVTASVCPVLQFAGLLTGVSFADFTGDNKPDLVVCGEWMPVRFFTNDGHHFNEVTGSTGLAPQNGQWRSLHAADLDGDGDLDLVAGNLGLNTKYRVSNARPMALYAADFDGNGSLDLLPAYYMKDNEGAEDLFPALDRSQLAEQVPAVKKKYLRSADYAGVNMRRLIAALDTTGLFVKTCETTTSVWIENRGNGRFVQHALPPEAQLWPVNAILVRDVNGDGHMDLLLAGNEYGTEYSVGRYDAGYGLLLMGEGSGRFTPSLPQESGFVVDGDVRSMATVETRSETQVLVAVNNDNLRSFVTRATAGRKK